MPTEPSSSHARSGWPGSPARRPRFLRSTLAGTALALAAALVLAQTAVAAEAWPAAKPITFIVPFPPGGGTDAFARPLSVTLARELGQRILIDNRAGAGGNVGASLGAQAPADGYHWFMGGVHHAIAPSVYPRLDYSLKNDFVPVALVSSVPQVIIVNPKRIAARTLPDFLAHARANPGRVNYASAGSGTSHHLAAELFKLQTKTELVHVPYRGAGPALQDVISGQVDVMFDGLGSSAQHITSQRVIALAVASDRRAEAFPDVQTTVEGGVPSYQVATWYGLWAPKGTPQAAIDGMIEGVKKAYAAPEIRKTWSSLGSTMPDRFGPDFGGFVDGEMARWTEVVKAADIRLE